MLFTEPINPIRPIKLLKENNDFEKYAYKPIFYIKRIGSKDSLLESKYLYQFWLNLKCFATAKYNLAAQKLAQPSESQESKDGPQAQTQAEIKNETDRTENIKSPSSPSSPKTPGVTMAKPSLKSQLWPSKKLAAAKVTAPPKEPSSPSPVQSAQNESVRRHSQHRPSGQSDAMMSVEIGPPSQSEEVGNDRKFSMNSDIFFESEVTSPSPILNISSNRSTSINPPYSQLKGKKSNI